MEGDITISDQDFSLSIKFTCIICRNSQEVSYYYSGITPICNECLKDLKEIILKKREDEGV